MKKYADRCFLALILAALILVPVLSCAGLLLHGSGISYYENRTLTARPAFTEEAFLEGTYFSGWEDWYSDRIVGRETLMGLHTALELDLLRRPVVNDVVVSDDVLVQFYSFERWNTDFWYATAETVCDGIAELRDTVEACGGHYYYLGLPHQSHYFSDRYPDYLNDGQWNVQPHRLAMNASCQARDISFLDMETVYDALGRPRELYFGGDHHYSYAGAWVAYQALMEKINADSGLDLRVLTEADVDFVTLPNHFMGSESRKLYDKWDGEDRAVIGVLKEPIPFTRFDNGLPVESTVYALPERESDTVTYELYMGGDKGETVIDTGREELPSCLIYGDSFTNPLETLLYASFNVTRSIDLRHYSAMSLTEYIEEYRPDVVICVRDDTVYLSTGGNGAVR